MKLSVILLPTDKNSPANIGTAQVEKTCFKKLSGIKINFNLNFTNEIKKYGPEKRRLTINAFFPSQFINSSLTFIFHTNFQK